MGPAARLLLLGVAVHALYTFSVIDIYFGSPVVRGVEPVDASALFSQAPAARLVLFSADGLRADKFFEFDPSSNTSKAPHLRSIIEHRGAWGISHARAPTESRPGHVSMIAGFYEDISAVTKGWKHNPIQFDSLFNRSVYTFGFGSPDIVPMFSELTAHMESKTYPPEAEDFGADASHLDEWVFREAEGLLGPAAAANASLDRLLRAPGLVLFLHLLGLDTNGHAHRPHSPEYAANIRLVDAGVRRIEELVERFYHSDGRTAYVFTADHGMSDKGNHGDGEPHNTECPLVVWGAGFPGPRPAPPPPGPASGWAKGRAWRRHEAGDGRQAAAWRLGHVERTDVEQADLAPLMASVLGLASPCNSEGVLPAALLRAPPAYRALAATHNARQLLAQFRTKEARKRATALFGYAPYGPLAAGGAAEAAGLADDGAHGAAGHAAPPLSAEERLAAAERRLAAGAAGAEAAAAETADEVSAAVLAGFRYVQTYDRFFLLPCVVLGYLGWMAFAAATLLHEGTPQRDGRTDPASSGAYRLARAAAAAAQAALSLRIAALALPWRTHLYPAAALFLWTQAARRWPTLARVHRAFRGHPPASPGAAYGGAALRALALAAAMLALAASYTLRPIYSVLLLGAGALWPDPLWRRPSRPRLEWAAACALAAVFPLLPVDVGARPLLVHAGAVLLSASAAWAAARTGSALSGLQALLALAAAATVASSDATRAAKGGLPLPNQLAAWALAASWLLVQVPAVAAARFPWHRPRARPAAASPPAEGAGEGRPLRRSTRNKAEDAGAARAGPHAGAAEAAAAEAAAERRLGRLRDVLGGFAAPVVLLSVAYEALFYWAFARLVLAWAAAEARADRGRDRPPGDPATPGGYRPLRWAHARAAAFLLVLVNAGFFGTGNVASISSFELASTYRFLTLFAPFTMAALLLFKILAALLAPAAALVAAEPLLEMRPMSAVLLALAMSDVATVALLFQVREAGSWQEIGVSISQYGIFNANILSLLLLYALARLLLRDPPRPALPSRKAA